MNNAWGFITDFIFISFLILMATFLKARIKYLRQLIVPTSMIAGFLGLLLGPELLGWLPLNLDTLGDFVYHLMGVGFISLSLKEREVHRSKNIVNAGMLIVSTYLIQGLIGFALFLGLTGLFKLEMFPGIGLLLPLGYGQGPGQAYSIGSQWEALGVTGGGNLGLTIAGLGFIWATLVGIVFMNMLLKHKKYRVIHINDEKYNKKIIEKIDPDEIPLSDAIDKLTFQGALIGTIYLMTYLTIFGLERLLTPLGTYGVTLAQLLIGFHFLIGSLYAMLVRVMLNGLKNRGLHLEHVPNNYLLQRISGFSFDYMIATSITAISIVALKAYVVPILILTTLGGLVTILFLLLIVPRLFPEESLPNLLGFYGMLTGTISSGMALVKAVDPKFQSNTTDHLVMGSATAILFGFPLLLILNIPIVGYIQDQPIMYLYTFFALALYFFILLSLLIFRTRKAKRKIN